MAGNETTFNKLLAVKAGGGNPGTPGSGDILDLAFGSVSLTSSLQILDGPLAVGFNGENAFVVDDNYAFLGPASGVETYNLTLYGILGAQGVSTFTHTGGNTNAPDFQVDGYAKFAGVLQANDLTVDDDLTVSGDLAVTGISTLTGAVQAQDTLNVTNGVGIGGTLDVTGAVDFDSTLNVDGNATFAQSATINGNLTVLGTLVTKQTESVLISDNYIDMNSDYATASPQDTGLTFNYSPIANATITAMDSQANTITLAANSGIALNPGDIILVTGLDAADVQNEGLYEVLTFASDVITVNVASGLTFLKHAVATTLTGLTATLAHVNLGVLRVATTGDLQYGENSSANITFGDVPYDGYVGEQEWESTLFLKAPNAGSILQVRDMGDVALFEVDADKTRFATDLEVFNGADASSSHSVILDAVQNHPSPFAGTGNVYTKTESGIAELFYNSNINNVAVPIQITKDGALNVTIPSVTLQNAYNNSTSPQITTDAQNGAVTINDGTQGVANALEVTGTTALTGNLTVTGAVSLVETAISPTPDLDSGSVYVAADPAAAGHAELWYYGDGTANAVMITKNGQLNIDVLTFSLQAAYEDGASIYTQATDPNSGAFGPVKIIDGTGGLEFALRVMGNLGVFDGNGSEIFSVDPVGNNTIVSGTLTGKGDVSIVDAQSTPKFTVAAASGNTSISGTLGVIGNLTASANVEVTGILDLNGSVDADVTGFDVASTGSISLAATGLLNLSGSSITANLSVTAGAAIGNDKLVAMSANGLVEALANAKDVIALGASVAMISQGASAAGKIAEIGTVSVKVEVNLASAIVAGERLYLSAVDAGRVTNVPPSASNTTVFQVGVALAGAAAGSVAVLAFRPQFLYNNY